MDAAEGRLPGDAVAGSTLDAEEAPIGGEADVPLEVAPGSSRLRPTATSRVLLMVVSVRSPRPLLEVLLDAGALVVDVQRQDDPVADDAGAKYAGEFCLITRRSKISDTCEGNPDQEIVAHHLVEELPPRQRAIEDLGQGELGLQDRRTGTGSQRTGPWASAAGAESPAIWSSARGWSWRRAWLAMAWARSGSAQCSTPLSSASKGDALLGQLPLQVFVAIEADLHRGRGSSCRT